MAEELNIARSIGAIESHIASYGISVVQHNDFSRFEKVARKVRGRPVSGQFDGRFFDFNTENAFWLEYKAKGKTIAVCAYRLDRLGELSLTKFLSQHERIYEKPNRIASKQCPLSDEISGKALYIGEFSLPDKYRKKGISGIMVFLGTLISALRWRDIDWFYGYTNRSLAHVGFIEQMFFNHMEPFGAIWIDEPKGVKSSDYLVALDRLGLRRVACLIVSEGLAVHLPRNKDARGSGS